MEGLDKLIEAVEGGTATEFQFLTWRPGFTGTRKESATMQRAYHGSIDAAKALHDALLDSGFHAEIWACCTRPQVKVVRVDDEHIGYDDNPARAWLIAALKAYRSTQGETA